jgi:arginyl-tRNA synthetase
MPADRRGRVLVDKADRAAFVVPAPRRAAAVEKSPQALGGLAEAGRLPGGLDLSAVTVEPPRDPSHGDMATNAAMVLARPARLAPREIAGLLAERLAADPRVTAAEVAGPGFLNLRLDPGLWLGVLPRVIARGTDYGRSEIGLGRRINVEYVSANPTGPLHVGHGRGAVVGDALAALLEKAGYAVTREYYINDAGAQVDALARSVHVRYRQALGEDRPDPRRPYPGDYLIPLGEAIADRPMVRVGATGPRRTGCRSSAAAPWRR